MPAPAAGLRNYVCICLWFLCVSLWYNSRGFYPERFLTCKNTQFERNLQTARLRHMHGSYDGAVIGVCVRYTYFTASLRETVPASVVTAITYIPPAREDASSSIVSLPVAAVITFAPWRL